MPKEPLPRAFSLTATYDERGFATTHGEPAWKLAVTPAVKSLAGSLGPTFPEALRNLADEIERLEPRHRTQATVEAQKKAMG